MSPERNFGNQPEKDAVISRRLFVGLGAAAALLASLDHEIPQYEREIDAAKVNEKQVEDQLKASQDYRRDLLEHFEITGEDVDAATWSPQD